jgi:hypothetical protein
MRVSVNLVSNDEELFNHLIRLPEQLPTSLLSIIMGCDGREGTLETVKTFSGQIAFKIWKL